MKNKLCSICGKEYAMQYRSICNKCNAIRTKKYYNKEKIKARLLNDNDKTINCLKCGKKIIKYRDTQLFCLECSKEVYNISLTNKFKETTNNYIKKEKSSEDLHRSMIEELFYMKDNEIVHHVDENIENNIYSNFLILSRNIHAKLHVYLRLNKFLYDNKLSPYENTTSPWIEIRNIITFVYLKENNQETYTVQNYLDLITVIPLTPFDF